jgi:uncharacterized protein (DUF58 family)
MLSFTDKVEKVIPPKKGKNNILRIITEVLDHHPTGTKTSISTALKAINEIWRRRSVVFLFSDFQDENYKQDLAITAKRHDLICVKINDKAEKDIPDIGLLEMIDPETGQTLFIDSGAQAKAFRKASRDFDEQTQINLSRSGVDVINLNTDESYVPALIRFFKDRETKIRLG